MQVQRSGNYFGPEQLPACRHVTMNKLWEAINDELGQRFGQGNVSLNFSIKVQETYGDAYAIPAEPMLTLTATVE